MAHSFGGLIARAYLAIHEARVAGLVMVETSVPHARLWPDLSPYCDGDRADATTIDIAAGAAELSTPTRGRPAAVLTGTRGRWSDPRADAAIDAY